MSLPISTPNNPQEKTGVIYRIYHKASMKSYIGKTIAPERRIREHFNGRGKSPVIENAIKKYGKEAFVVEILEKDIPEPHLSKMEILYIRFFNSQVPNGYNLTQGGDGWKIGHSHNKGRYPSEETRRKMSMAQKGHTRNKGKTPWNKGKKGVYSEEALRQMSETSSKTAWNKGKTGVYSP